MSVYSHKSKASSILDDQTKLVRFEQTSSIINPVWGCPDFGLRTVRWYFNPSQAIDSLSSDSSDSDTDYEDYYDFGLLKSYNKALKTATATQHMPYLDEEKVNKQALLEDVFVQVYKSTPKMMHIPICQLQK